MLHQHKKLRITFLVILTRAVTLSGESKMPQAPHQLSLINIFIIGSPNVPKFKSTHILEPVGVPSKLLTLTSKLLSLLP